jgi:hypothetical protein
MNSTTSWPQSAIELYRQSDRCLSVKSVPIFADRECHVVSATDPHGHILGFEDRSSYYFSQTATQLYSYFSENLIAPGIEPGPLDL